MPARPSAPAGAHESTRDRGAGGQGAQSRQETRRATRERGSRTMADGSGPTTVPPTRPGKPLSRRGHGRGPPLLVLRSRSLARVIRWPRPRMQGACRNRLITGPSGEPLGTPHGSVTLAEVSRPRRTSRSSEVSRPRRTSRSRARLGMSTAGPGRGRTCC